MAEKRLKKVLTTPKTNFSSRLAAIKKKYGKTGCSNMMTRIKHAHGFITEKSDFFSGDVPTQKKALLPKKSSFDIRVNATVKRLKKLKVSGKMSDAELKDLTKHVLSSAEQKKDLERAENRELNKKAPKEAPLIKALTRKEKKKE